MGQLYSYLCLSLLQLYYCETISIYIYVLVCKLFLIYTVNKYMHDCKDPIIRVSRINMTSYGYHYYETTIENATTTFQRRNERR